jgi:phosphoenolpyruvate-protein phosphotransferase/dihydroxyacetone kinase phosphotransfer subunit
VTDPAEPRVGLVIVSHSAQVADGVVALAREMAGESVRLIAAGGGPDGSFGTDAARVAEAIAEADAGAGVVILADLGSAEMSAELALQLVDPELAARARLSQGPLVEGAVKAAAQASTGSDLATVLETADRAIEAPAASTAGAAAATAGDVIGDRADGRQAEVVVRNLHGLHARPAARFVQAASVYRSAIWLENLATGSAPADAKSINGVMLSGVDAGHRIRIFARGDDQDEAVAALSALVEGGFGEEMVAEVPAVSSRPAAGPPAARQPAALPSSSAQAAESGPAGEVRGLRGAPGAVIGPIWRYEPPAAAGAKGMGGGAGEIRAAASEAAGELEALAARVRAMGRPEEAEIFGAQALMATDPSLLGRASELAGGGQAIDAAVTLAAGELAAQAAALPSELLAARAADLHDVGARIVRILRGERLILPETPSVAVAEDLPPSIAAEMPAGLLLGIALEGGSATAHAVILARGLGIPAIVGARGLLEASRSAGTVAIDGDTGDVVLDPDDAARAEFERRASALARQRAAAASLRGKPAATVDGHRVKLLANIGGPEDAARALAMGAEGVGLFRTEFLFMKRQTAPTEEEQVEPYRRVFEAFGPDRPVVVRLADIGGDKALPYLNLPPEENPFLGVRAIRLADRWRELLSAQLRAIWRAAGLAGVTPHVMAPMVSTLADARLLMELREEARAAVAAASPAAPLPDRMVTGVMVEVPSAALIAPELARLVDFFSIGTNDLTQYTLAADRSNPALAHLQDALHPAVLRLISRVVGGADTAGIPVAVCGELAGDPLGALVLVGLGVDELSADAGSLDGIHVALAGVTMGELEGLAVRALAAPDAAAVRAMAGELPER